MFDSIKNIFNTGNEETPLVYGEKPDINREKSAELYEKAKQYFPGGVNSPVRAFKSVYGTPLFIEKGDGCRLWDADGNEFILKPGEQSVNDRKGKLSVKENINTEEVVAWKNGFFMYESADFQTIARQASRWYNVEFIFENKKAGSEIFHGTFSRDASLAELLKILELSDVKFKIDGDKVIIK